LLFITGNVLDAKTVRVPFFGSGIVFNFLFILSTYFGFYWFDLDYKFIAFCFF
jgi:hypothetical protein